MMTREQRLAEKAARMRAWRLANPEESKRRAKLNHEKHRATDLARSRRWAVANKDRIRETNKAWSKANAAYKRDANASWYKRNRERVLEEGKNRRKENPEIAKRSRLAVYGLTPEEFNTMLVAQDFRCAACHEPFDMQSQSRSKRPNVDHDHQTGEKRGLLCMFCNCAIGFAKENPERLRDLAKYLDNYVLRPALMPAVNEVQK